MIAVFIRRRGQLRRWLVGALLGVAPAATALAQAGETTLLSGRVTDRDGQPIAGARVTVLDARAVTASNGRYQLRYQLRRSADGSARLRASAVGYRATEIILPGAGGAPTYNVVLEQVPQLLPTVSVTGTTPDELASIPGATSLIGPSVLRNRSPISVMDALRTVPGIQTADEDPFGLNLNVGFRGLPPRRSSRTLLLEDGMPILLGPYGDPSMHYAPPVEALDRVEVIKGSGQIMNGPQTVGGVLNLVTRQPPTDGSYGEATLGGGALGYRNAQVRLGAGRAGYGLSFDYVYRAGDGVRREQGHRFHNAMVKGVVPIGDSQALLLKAGLWDEASRISETGLTQAEFEANPFSLPFSAAGRFDVRRYMGQAIHDARIGRARLRTNAFVSNTKRASWRQSGESEERLGEDEYADDFNCAPDATTYAECGNQGRPREYTVVGVEPRLSMDFGSPAAGVAVDAGVRLYAEDVRRRQYVGSTPTSRLADAELTLDNEIDTRAIAGFVQTRIRSGALTLSPAMRIEQVTQNIDNRFPGRESQVDQSYTQILPGIGATYNRADHATLFAGVHRGFAPPRPADIYQPEPGQSIVLVDPETSWNWEVGGRLTPRAGVSAEATFFRMDFGNEIIEAPASEGQRFINGGRTVHQGVELGTRVSLGTLFSQPDDLTLGTAYTFIPTARFTGGDERGDDVVGNRLPYAPRHLLSASASFAHRTGITVGTALEYTSAQFGDEDNTREPSDDGQDGLLPAYSVTNAFASYAIPATRLQLRASVRNVFDQLYITQRNEGIYTGVRRLVRGEIQWSF